MFQPPVRRLARKARGSITRASNVKHLSMSWSGRISKLLIRKEARMKKLLLGLLLMAAIGAVVYVKMIKEDSPCCCTEETPCQ